MLSSIVYIHSYHSSHFFFFFNDTATTEIYTLSLHDALPISALLGGAHLKWRTLHNSQDQRRPAVVTGGRGADRKSTRLNSSHMSISYAVFCLKKKKQTQKELTHANENAFVQLVHRRVQRLKE